MYCKPFLLVLFVACSVYCSAQNIVTDSSATVVGYWQKGDVANFTLTQVKEKYENKKLLMSGSSTSQVEIKVLYANKDSYILNWKYGDIKINGEQPQDEAVKEFASLTKGINFIYKVSELGEFQELVNWAEVQASVLKIIDKLIEKSSNPNLQPSLTQARKVFSSKESIEMLIMKDIQLFHSVYGGEYLLKQKLAGETELPNILGGNPFPATVEVELYELDQKKSTCKIRVLQVIDKQKAADEINAWLKKNGQSKTNNPNPIDITDKTEYEIELERGWINRYIHTRTAEVNGMKNVEKQELIRVK